jgi:hypothetical protein
MSDKKIGRNTSLKAIEIRRAILDFFKTRHTFIENMDDVETLIQYLIDNLELSVNK